MARGVILLIATMPALDYQNEDENVPRGVIFSAATIPALHQGRKEEDSVHRCVEVWFYI